MENKVQEIVATILGLDRSDINIDSSSESVDTWDSLNHMNLIMAIEEEFEVTFEEEEIIEMTSVKALVDFLEKNA
jgi:acyl carrier protein